MMGTQRSGSHGPSEPKASAGVSRRSFMQTLGLSAAGAAIADRAAALGRETQGAAHAPGASGPEVIGPADVSIELNVNGRMMGATIDPATTLMECLRIHLGLTGTKEVCDRASCGACSVLVDGRLVNACMMLALDAIGSRIETVEGLAAGDALHPLQRAFIDHDALQCGYCTPGLIMAAKSLLDRTARPDLRQIRKGLAGNICRCGTYTNVFNAVLVASGQEPVRDSGGAGQR